MSPDTNPIAEISDEVAVRQILAGNPDDACLTLVRRYQEKLFRVVFSFTANAEDAEDICQQTFTEALTRLHQLKDPKAFAAWLFKIGRNRARDLIRASKSRASREERWDGLQTQVSGSPDMAIENRQQAKSLARHLGTLPELYRSIIVLHYWMDESVQVIGQQLELPIGTVKSYLFRARKILAQALAKEKS